MASRDIATLDPRLQPLCRSFLTAANSVAAAQGCEVRLVCTYRSEQEQAAIYAQGRTAPGPIISGAKPGQSKHNCTRNGLPCAQAFDIGVFSNGYYMGDHPLYDSLGPLAPEHGLVWGGTFRNLHDAPHYELPGPQPTRAEQGGDLAPATLAPVLSTPPAATGPATGDETITLKASGWLASLVRLFKR